MMNQNDLTCDDLGIGGFRLYQPKNGYRFSLDAPLLAALVPVAPEESVLDMGCGSGVLPLLLLGREPSLHISGLELRQTPYELALFNMQVNGAAVSVVQGDAMAASEYFPRQSFDFIISNPPYYPVGACRLPRHPDVAAAKTEVYWNPLGMFEQAILLLKEGGRLGLLIDAERKSEMISLGRTAGFFPLCSREIYTKETNLKPKRAYLLFAKSAATFLEEPPLILYKKTGELTPEMKRIFGIYYGTGTLPCGNPHR